MSIRGRWSGASTCLRMETCLSCTPNGGEHSEHANRANRGWSTHLLAVFSVFAQLVGASVGGFLLVASFPEAARQAVHLGTPALGRGVTPGVGIVVETVLTFLLVFTVFGVAVDARGPRGTAGLMIGLVIAMDLLAGGVLTGAAM